MKVEANLADVNTQYEPIPGGDYPFELKEIKRDEKGTWNFKSVCIQQGEQFGKPVYDNFNYVKNDGGENKYAKAQMKRYFEALDPDNANNPEADTDSLLNGQFTGVVEIQEYEIKKEGPNKGKKGKSNKFTNILPLQR